MRKTLLTVAAATMLLAGTGLASAQTTTTTTSTWTNDQGTEITKYSSTQKYPSYVDPGYKPSVGAALPDKVTIYPLPDSMKVEKRDTYSYGIVNDRPIVVERTTRKVVHSWE
jgi:hypothetical protein